MRVYQVTRQRVDWDGWPKGDTVVIGTFTTLARAKAFMHEKTGDPMALQYGHASLPTGVTSDDRYRFGIVEHFVEE